MRETLEPLGVIDFCGGQETNKSKLWQHAPAYEAKRNFSENGLDWDLYFKYVVVRNPWDRYLSFLNYYKTEAYNYKENREKLSEPAIIQGEMASSIFDSHKTLSDVMLYFAKMQGGIWESQEYYINDKSGNQIVDYIGDFDNINEEFYFFCKKSGIKDTLKLKHSNKSVKKIDPNNVFTQEIIDLIAKKENYVINLMNYQPPK